MRASLGDGAEKAERFKGSGRALAGFGIAGRGAGEALAGPVHGCPKSVVVACLLGEFGFVSGPGRADPEHIPVSGAAVALVNLAFEECGLGGERHRPGFDHPHAGGRGEPGPVTCYGDCVDIVVRQPAPALAVFPGVPVEADRAHAGAEPHQSIAGRRQGGEIVVRQAVVAIEESPIGVADADTLGAREVQAAFGIVGHRAYIHRSPTTRSAVRQQAAPGARPVPFEQAGSGGYRQPVAASRELANAGVQSRHPGKGLVKFVRRGQHRIPVQQDHAHRAGRCVAHDAARAVDLASDCERYSRGVGRQRSNRHVRSARNRLPGSVLEHEEAFRRSRIDSALRAYGQAGCDEAPVKGRHLLPEFTDLQGLPAGEWE